MKKFFSFIIRQSVAIVLIVVFVLAFGVYSTIRMPINLLPDINVPMVCVQVIYTGANAQTVEEDVTGKIEDGLSAIGGVTDINSYSYDNLSAVVLSFDYGTDTSEKENEIIGKLPSLGLPDGITSDVYDIDLNAEALAVLSVTSSGENGLDNAHTAAKELSARLSAIDGVEEVEIKGGAEKIWAIRPQKGLELIAPVIVQAFSYGALDIPLGDLTEGERSVQVKNNSKIKTEDDIKNMPLEIPSSAFKSVHDKIRDGIMAFFPRQRDEDDETYNNRANIDYPQAAQLFANTPLYFSFIKSQIQGQGGNFSDNLIKEIILKSGDENIVVNVSEVATVTEEEEYSSYVYFGDGAMPQIIAGTTIEIYKANGANSAAVVESVKNVYKDYLTGNAAEELGIRIELLDDQSQFISDSISNVLISMLIGGALAVLVIFVFLKKIKTSLIIAITMPLSVLAAIICLSLMGITLNMVSLGGLAVGIGMLVDNSIVVIESVSKHRDMDKTAFEAAVDGTTEVGGALFGSTITTVCVFIPIIFSGGLTGEIFTDLSFAVIFSLVFSLIVAVTVIPTLYAIFCNDKRMLKGGRLSRDLPTGRSAAEQLSIDGIAQNSDNLSQEVTANESSPEYVVGDGLPEAERKDGAEPEEKTVPVKKGSFKRKLAALKEPKIMTAITSFYGRALPVILKHKIIPILSAIIIFGASIGMLFLTGTEFLPSIDKGQLEVTATYEAGASLEDIKKDVANFAAKIESELKDNIDYISVSVGKNGLLALTDTGIITVQLNTNRGTDEVVQKIRKMAEDDADRAEKRSGMSVKEIDGVVASLTSGTDDLSVTVLGEDNDALVDIAEEIIKELQDNGFKDVKSSAAEKELQTDIVFDRKKAAEYGLDYQTLVMTLRIGIASYTACTAEINGEEYSVNVSFDKDSVTDIESLKNFTVGNDASGNTIKLSDVAQISEPREVDACIRRSGGKKMVSVSATLPNVDTGTAGTRMKEIAGEVLQRHAEGGYSFQQSGISSYLNDAFGGLAVALVISFFLLYAVMAVQFGSALKPLIIMSSIPFSFTGGFLALVITGTTLNVVSFIGLIMLMGVIVNNAIVMLEKIKQLHDEGMAHFDAVREACKVRLRPIFMTTLTTILALIPLAIGVGQGSELMQPLGIVVIGGLLIGTLVTLVLVPAVYCAVHGLSEKRPNGRQK